MKQSSTGMLELNIFQTINLLWLIVNKDQQLFTSTYHYEHQQYSMLDCQYGQFAGMQNGTSLLFGIPHSNTSINSCLLADQGPLQCRPSR